MNRAHALYTVLIPASLGLSKFQVAQCKTRTWVWMHKS